MLTNSVPFWSFLHNHYFSQRNHEKVCTIHGSNPEMQCGSGNVGMADTFFFVFPIFCQSFLPHSLFSLNQKIFNLMQYNQEVKIVWTSLKVECQLLEGPVAKKKGMWHKLEDLWHQEAPPVFPSRKLDLAWGVEEFVKAVEGLSSI